MRVKDFLQKLVFCDMEADVRIEGGIVTDIESDYLERTVTIKGMKTPQIDADTLKRLAQVQGFVNYESACIAIRKAGYDPLDILNPYRKLTGRDEFLYAAFDNPQDIALIREAYEAFIDRMCEELEGSE